MRPNYQRVAEIEQRFGQPQKIYSAGSHSSMSAEFAADGQVCQIWVYPRRVSGSGNYLGNKLEYGEVWSFLNSFVSPQDRGLKQELNFGTTATGGGSASTTYPYENVLFTFMTAFPLQKYSDSEHPLRKEEFRLSLPHPAQPDIKDRLPSKYDFRRTDDAEIVPSGGSRERVGLFSRDRKASPFNAVNGEIRRGSQRKTRIRLHARSDDVVAKPFSLSTFSSTQSYRVVFRASSEWAQTPVLQSSSQTILLAGLE